jgi:hypothetical protein
MIEYLLLLLLPVAVYFGWWLARAIERRSSGKRKRLFSDQYFQGLNYLLNEQPDKAIQVFLELAEVNQETVETHMALGNLFRRRGEVDRAIRFHQNIIAKHGLQPEQRTQALLELGEDYMRAGLLDRAERLFSELIETDAHTPSALRSLLDIYQQEKDWDKALEQAQRLEQVTGTRHWSRLSASSRSAASTWAASWRSSAAKWPRRRWPTSTPSGPGGTCATRAAMTLAVCGRGSYWPTLPCRPVSRATRSSFTRKSPSSIPITFRNCSTTISMPRAQPAKRSAPDKSSTNGPNVTTAYR